MLNKTDRECREYLEKVLWNGIPVCPHCGAEGAYVLKRIGNYRCMNLRCRKDFTVITGTVFENKKIPFATWFAAIWLATTEKNGINGLELARRLHVQRLTAQMLIKKIKLLVENAQKTHE